MKIIHLDKKKIIVENPSNSLILFLFKKQDDFFKKHAPFNFNLNFIKNIHVRTRSIDIKENKIIIIYSYYEDKLKCDIFDRFLDEIGRSELIEQVKKFFDPKIKYLGANVLDNFLEKEKIKKKFVDYKNPSKKFPDDIFISNGYFDFDGYSSILGFKTRQYFSISFKYEIELPLEILFEYIKNQEFDD